MNLFKSEYVKIYFSLLLIMLLSWPYLRDIFSKEAREMLKGMKGENGVWDMSEIWEHHSLRVAKASFAVFVFMVVMKTISGIDYSWELYALSFFGTLGSNGLAAFLIYIKKR